jgi:hypothetical protein
VIAREPLSRCSTGNSYASVDEARHIRAHAPDANKSNRG